MPLPDRLNVKPGRYWRVLILPDGTRLEYVVLEKARGATR